MCHLDSAVQLSAVAGGDASIPLYRTNNTRPERPGWKISTWHVDSAVQLGVVSGGGASIPLYRKTKTRPEIPG